jgi:7-carboxy-7-deazaguanine synthase
MHIIEIYKSIQGESTWTGLPCTFLRLAGCNLRCSWCDSEYTFSGGRHMTDDEIFGEVEKLGVKLVEITGGEPMLQKRELVPFMQRLVDSGYEVLIETSGERPLADVPKRVHKIVDVKCPDSGESGKFSMANLETLTDRDEIKFVIASRQDYEFARQFIREQELESKVNAVVLSPAFRKDSVGRTSDNCLVNPQDMVDWMLEDRLNARLGLQIHKYVWEPQTKGV